MALTLDDLRLLPETIQDLTVDTSGGFLSFRLVHFAVNLLNEDDQSAFDCRCPFVGQRPVISKTTVMSNGPEIPTHFRPESLESTLERFIETIRLRVRAISDRAQSSDPKTSTGTLRQAALLFRQEQPTSSGFLFGQTAMDVFNQATANAST